MGTFHGNETINTGTGQTSSIEDIVGKIKPSKDLFEDLGEYQAEGQTTSEEGPSEPVQPVGTEEPQALRAELPSNLAALADAVNAAKSGSRADASPSASTMRVQKTPEEVRQDFMDGVMEEASRLMLPAPQYREGETAEEADLRYAAENLAGNIERMEASPYEKAQAEQRADEARGKAKREARAKEQEEAYEAAGKEDIGKHITATSPIWDYVPEAKRHKPMTANELLQYMPATNPLWQMIPENLRPSHIANTEFGVEAFPGVKGGYRESRIPESLKALPGAVMRRLYEIPNKIFRQKNKTVDQKIEEAMKAQAKTALLDEAYQFSERDDPLSNLDEATAEKRIKDVREFIDTAYCPIESQTIKTETIVLSPDPKTGKSKTMKVHVITYTNDVTRQAIDQYMREMHYSPEELWLVHHQLMKFLGYSPDTKGKILNKDSDKLPDELVQQALRDMLDSQKKYGHPYHMTRRHVYGGTQCFPIGVMSVTEANILCKSGGVREGTDPYDLITEVRNYFVEEVQPKIYATGDWAQIYSLENFLRALCSEAGISPRKYNTSTIYDRGYAQQVRECDPRLNPNIDPDVAQVRLNALQQADARKSRARQKLDKQRNKTTYYYAEDVIDDQTGEILHKKGERVDQKDMVEGSNRAIMMSPRVHPVQAFCTFSANTMKVMGVFGYTPIILSGFIENFAGSLYAWEANKLYERFAKGFYSEGFESVRSKLPFAKPRRDPGNMFKPSKLLYAHMNKPETWEAMKAMKALEMAGGMDAMILFFDNYDSLTVDNVREFLSNAVNKEGLFKGKGIDLVHKISSKANDALQFLLPGDIGMERLQARRWLEALLMNFQNTYAAGDVLEKSYTADEILEMIQAEGVQHFMAGMMDTVAGRDAFLMMRNQTMSRESPLTHAVDSLLKRHGLVNLVVTSQIDTYFKYGLNLIQLYMPFSNTISYLVVRGANRANKQIKGGADGMAAMDLPILDYQMGGHDAFGQGLVKNLLYDFTRIGNLGAFACLVAGIFLMIGFDEPEDPSLKYNWQEYRIGAKIGLGPKDENGNAQGLPLFRAWWLDDLTGFGLPLAYTIASHWCNIKKDEPDFDFDMKFFTNATADILGGASVFDLIYALKNAQKNVMEFDKLMSDPNTMPSSGWFSFAYMNLFELPTAKAFGKMMPSAFKDWGQDQYDHTSYEVYNRSSDVPGKTKDVTDWVELQRRINSKYNPLYAHFLNLTQNGYWEDDGTSQKTGYLYNEMPLATEKDKRTMTFMHDIDFDEDAIPDKEADPVKYETYMEERCENLFAKMAEYGWDVDTALANGFLIPYQLRIEAANYCLRRVNQAENKYNELVNQGIRGVDKENAYHAKEQVWDYYYNKIYKGWVKNRDIPWSDAGYVKMKTDYDTVYYYTDTGKPASVIEYLDPGNGLVEMRKIAKGNKPNSFLPFTMPETENKGYNYESLPSYYDERLTDVNKLYRDLTTPNEKGEIPTVPYGRDAGVPTANIVFGGSPRFPTEEPILSEEFRARNNPVAGARNLIPFDETMLDSLPNVKKQSKKNEEG